MIEFKIDFPGVWGDSSSGKHEVLRFLRAGDLCPPLLALCFPLLLASAADKVLP